MQPTRYALIGASGYIAPRHLKAMRETGGNLISAFDVNDSVGILDSHFPETAFFTEFEQFSHHINHLRRNRSKVDYISICTPNYLHKAHSSFSLRNEIDAICEKPLVLNVSDLDELSALEYDTGKRVYSILQLRLHPAIIALRNRIAEAPRGHTFDVDLTYITSRGAWYFSSWKGFDQKSGGIATNIGVHFFDMLGYLFGRNTISNVHYRSPKMAAGYLEFERARVRWMLSIDRDNLPSNSGPDQTTYRSITIDGTEIEFSSGFTDLHTISYQHILNGSGFGLEEVRAAIEMVEHIRHASLQPDLGQRHASLGATAQT